MCDSNLITKPNVGSGQISIANSNMDGEGTSTIVFTASSAGETGGGSVINSILIKAQVPVTQGMVRFFIHTGSGLYLFREVPIPNQPLAGGVGNTQPSFSIQFNVGFTMQSGTTLIATTQNSELFNVIVFGTDFGYCNCPS